MGGSAGLNFGGGGGGGFSKTQTPNDIKHLRRGVSDFFSQILQGSQNGGAFQSIFQNMFGGSADDYQNSLSALHDSLSGEGFAKNIGIAQTQLTPERERAIQEAASSTRAAAGTSGLRFSTDLNRNISRQTGDIENAFSDRALNLATEIQRERGSAAQGTFGLFANQFNSIPSFITGVQNLQRSQQHQQGRSFGTQVSANLS